MLNGTGDEERSRSDQSENSDGNEQEIQEVKQEFEEHKTTSLLFGCRGKNRTCSAGTLNRYVTITPPRRIRRSLLSLERGSDRGHRRSRQ